MVLADAGRQYLCDIVLFLGQHLQIFDVEWKAEYLHITHPYLYLVVKLPYINIYDTYKDTLMVLLHKNNRVTDHNVVP